MQEFCPPCASTDVRKFATGPESKKGRQESIPVGPRTGVMVARGSDLLSSLNMSYG